MAVLATGCASQPTLVRVDFEMRDKPADRQIEVVYQNAQKNPMCLLPEHWPNVAGKINQASDLVFLVVEGRRFPIENFNTGYCPKGCSTRVKPGEQQSARIAYADFGLPQELYGAPKRLEFAPMAYACR